MTNYRDISADLNRRAKAVTYPTSVGFHGFPVTHRQPGMILKYRDGKRYQVMSNGEQRRIKSQ